MGAKLPFNALLLMKLLSELGCKGAVRRGGCPYHGDVTKMAVIHSISGEFQPDL
jgi:hypothetical protein